MSSTPAATTASGQPIIVNVNAPQRKKMHHGLHLFLSIITGGLWLPVWLILAIANR